MAQLSKSNGKAAPKGNVGARGTNRPKAATQGRQTVQAPKRRTTGRTDSPDQKFAAALKHDVEDAPFVETPMPINKGDEPTATPMAIPVPKGMGLVVAKLPNVGEKLVKDLVQLGVKVAQQENKILISMARVCEHDNANIVSFQKEYEDQLVALGRYSKDTITKMKSELGKVLRFCLDGTVIEYAGNKMKVIELLQKDSSFGVQKTLATELAYRKGQKAIAAPVESGVVNTSGTIGKGGPADTSDDDGDEESPMMPPKGATVPPAPDKNPEVQKLQDERYMLNTARACANMAERNKDKELEEMFRKIVDVLAQRQLDRDNGRTRKAA